MSSTGKSLLALAWLAMLLLGISSTGAAAAPQRSPGGGAGPVIVMIDPTMDPQHFGLQVRADPRGAVTLQAAPRPVASPSPDVTGAGGSTNRTGTLIALGIALLLSIAAGLVVFLRDRGSDVSARPVQQPRRRWDGAGSTSAGPAGPGAPVETVGPGAPVETDSDPDRTVLRAPVRQPPAAGPGRAAGSPTDQSTDPDDGGKTYFRRR